MVKLTKMLEDSQETCEQHGAYMAKRCMFMGKEIKTICPGCAKSEEGGSGFSDTPPQYAGRSGANACALSSSGIPLRYRNASLKEAANSQQSAKAVERLIRFSASVVDGSHDGRFVVMMGGTGTGKTWLSCACLLHVMHAMRVQYVTESGIVQAARDSWSIPGATEGDALNRFRRAGLLVIDEIGAGSPSDPIRQRLIFDVIDYRYSNMKPTILTTNLDKPALVKWVGQRASERISQCGTVIPLVGKSTRASNRP